MPTNLSRLLLPLTLALLINPACNKKLPNTATSIPLISQARNFFDDSIAKMIKSKFDAYQFVGQFVMSGLLILLFFLFYVIFFGKHPTPFSSVLRILGVLLTIILPLYIIAQMKLNYKTIIIDTEVKTISFKIFFIKLTNKYLLEYFDGYIDTKVTDKYGMYKCFYLVKDGKLRYKISGRFYSNIDELQSGLSSLKYMGFIKYSFSL